jgi:hypothetical protein
VFSELFAEQQRHYLFPYFLIIDLVNRAILIPIEYLTAIPDDYIARYPHCVLHTFHKIMSYYVIMQNSELVSSVFNSRKCRNCIFIKKAGAPRKFSRRAGRHIVRGIIASNAVKREAEREIFQFPRFTETENDEKKQTRVFSPRELCPVKSVNVRYVSVT